MFSSKFKDSIKSYSNLRFRQVTAVSSLMGLSLLGLEAQANYAPKVTRVSNGYTILLDVNTPVNSKPIIGGDGNNYYQVGDPIELQSNSASVSAFGAVWCLGTTWGTESNWNVSSNSAYHRLFMYVPSAGISIKGSSAYRINSNLFMTVHTDIMNWVHKGGSTVCSNIAENDTDSLGHVPSFTSHFPITVTFYLNEKIIDGQIVVNAQDLGGYVRAFMNPFTPPTQNSWPIEETTAPIRLKASQLNLVSSCSTQTVSGTDGTGTGTLNLDHGALFNTNYDSRVTGQVNYNCTFSELTPVRIKLDYVIDSDAQKRLPLKNTAIDRTDKVYSKLTLRDETTGQTGGIGTDIRTSIEKLKTVTITSHLQGSNAVAGNYQGSAWVITTFD
ncbi:hypothetical protein [Acinetobacter guerrae]|uniref:hypothetical protein n=2 Tax=Acinetobacter guerrae TaxID=1843371 RepID=UPI001CA46A23|nr:hypothetical protein [Acinetobacter guerrae]